MFKRVTSETEGNCRKYSIPSEINSKKMDKCINNICNDLLYNDDINDFEINYEGNKDVFKARVLQMEALLEEENWEMKNESKKKKPEPNGEDAFFSGLAAFVGTTFYMITNPEIGADAGYMRISAPFLAARAASMIVGHKSEFSDDFSKHARNYLVKENKKKIDTLDKMRLSC